MFVYESLVDFIVGGNILHQWPLNDSLEDFPFYNYLVLGGASGLIGYLLFCLPDVSLSTKNWWKEKEAVRSLFLLTIVVYYSC